MIKKAVVIIFFLVNVSLSNAVQIIDKNIRHAYWRGEKICLNYQLDANQQELKYLKFNIDINDLIKAEFNAADFKGVELNTDKLKSGRYKVICSLKNNQRNVTEFEHFIYIAARPNPDRIRVWLWPHHKFGEKVYKLDDEAMKQLNWYADKGFNSFLPGGGVGLNLNYGGFTHDKFALYDYALYNGWEMGINAWNGFFVDVNAADALFKTIHKDFGRDYLTNPFHPMVAARQNQLNEELMKTIQSFPQIGVCFMESEIEDDIIPEMPLSKESLRNSYPLMSEHKFIAPGVIADNDENYIKRIYQYKYTDGIAVGIERAANMVHKYRPDIFTFTDPLRKTTVYGRYKGTNAISTWTYTNPDSKYMLYIETLIANGKPFNQGVIHMVTLLNYPGTVAPEDKGWVIMGPDRLTETSWINLSRNPDGLSYYIGSGLDPFNLGYYAYTPSGGVKNAPNIGFPYQIYPQTFDALKRFVNETVVPYGPMIKKLKRSARKVAVLSSESSDVYSASPRLLGHYGNYQVYSFYSLLNMIHIPADIVFDETIVECGLGGYEALVLPKCDTLTKTVYDKILDFQRKGGLIISDQYLRADIPGIIKCDFDFTYRDKVSAKALIDKKDYTNKMDNAGRAAKLENVEGVTAAEDQKRMEQYAAQLRQLLDGKIHRDIDSQSSTVLLNTLKKDDVRYLFIINDKRTYDERLGQYQAILEKGVAQEANISLKETSGDLYVYDIIEHRELSYSKKSQNIVFDVGLPAAGGKIIALMSQKPEKIEVIIPQILRRTVRHKFDIMIKDKNGHMVSGVEPINVEIVDSCGIKSEFSGFYAAQKGLCSMEFVAGENDVSGKWRIKVTDLVTGNDTERCFYVQ